MNNTERQALLREAFLHRFGYAPTHWVQAPGRVDLMGSHTDYNEGYVLTMSINRNTWIALRPRDDRSVHVASLNVDSTAAFSLAAITRDENVNWSNYVRGVAKILQEAGYALPGFDGLIHSTVPFGSGLSSSAALEVATGYAFQVLSDWTIDPVTMAKLTQKAENTFVGVNCGILDQYTSANGQAGHALLLDCRDITSTAALIDPAIHVVICDTRAERALTGSEYSERRAQCEEGAAFFQQVYPAVKTLRDVSLAQLDAHQHELPAIVARRCRFIIEENARVLALAQALPAKDLAGIAELTRQSYAGARDLYEIVVPEMEAMYAAMLRGPGVIGARQAGAGFGGCMVAFVAADAVEAFASHVEQAYQVVTGITPVVYPVTAAAGAGPVML